MQAKEIHSFLNSSQTHYRQHTERTGCGVGFKKSFAEYIAALDYGHGVQEFDEEELPKTTFEQANFIHGEVHNYLNDVCNKVDDLHPMVLELSVAEGDHFSYWFLFHLYPPFECFTLTISNAIKYRVSTKDKFLQETLVALTGFNEAVTGFVDTIELEDWFLTDLQNRL